MGGGRKHEAKGRSEEGRCAEKEGRGACVYPPMHGESWRKKRALLMACVGPLRRQVEMEEMIAETLFYCGDAGISLVGMERR